MEYKLIMAVSGFPSLYDTYSPTYRDLNVRSDSWRQVAAIVGVPEHECRRKWKTLRDQHRRERQREKERRESGTGLFNYRPWRYSSILSFLNPFIEARAAGTTDWALETQPPHPLTADMVGCSTTTETQSDDDNCTVAVADATCSSSSFPELTKRKRPSPGSSEAVRLKDTKMEPSDPLTLPLVQQSVHPLQHSLASLSQQQVLPRDVLDPTNEEELEEAQEQQRRDMSHSRASRRRMCWSSDGLLEALLQHMDSRNLDQKDDVTLFLLSLAPAMRRLCPEKQSLLRTKIQLLLHEAEFGSRDAEFT